MSPAPNGNTNAVKHAAFSDRNVAARLPDTVAELHLALSESIPYLQPVDAVLVEQTAWMLTRIRMIDDYLMSSNGGSLIDRRGRPKRAASLWFALQTQLRANLSMLGVGPKERAALLGGLAVASREAAVQKAQRALQVKYGEGPEAKAS